MGRFLSALALTAVVLFAGTQFMSSIPSFGLPNIEGSQVNDVDVTKLAAAFTSVQGLSAGETSLQGIDVTQNQRTIKQLPGWFAGSCTTLKDGKAKVTYHSDTKLLPPKVLPGVNGIELTVAEPTVRSIGITSFDSKAIHNSKGCGMFVKKDPDIQAMNRVVQKSACDWAANDTTQVEARRKDAASAAVAIAAAVGVVISPDHVLFQPVAKTLPAECEGLDK